MAGVQSGNLSTIVDFLEAYPSLHERTLKDVIDTFKTVFHEKDYMKTCSVICTLLMDGDLIPQCMQKALAISVLALFPIYCFDVPPSKSHEGDSPFLHALVQLIEKKEGDPTDVLSPALKRFTHHLISENNLEMTLSIPFHQVVESIDNSPVSPNFNMAPYKERVSKLIGNSTAIENGGVSVLIKDPTQSSGDLLREVVTEGGYDLTESFIPPFMRPAPPLYITLDEMAWMHPPGVPPHQQVALDARIVSENEVETEAKLLMAKALKTALTVPQIKVLVKFFETNKNLVHKLGMSPSKLKSLVECNTRIAFEFLIKGLDRHQLRPYFDALVEMEMSLQSMEVVNRLTMNMQLPKDFIHPYISNCITTCEKIKDKYMQNRLVRLVCVFFQSLARNKIIEKREVFMEMETFCLNFSGIREASALYKLLKNREEQLNTAEE